MNAVADGRETREPGKASPRVTEVKKGKAYHYPPLCDLCGLCAKLSLVRAFLANKPTVSSVRPHGLSPSIVGKVYQFPPSVTSVRCFLRFACSRP
jgi:hypothetical protein